MDFPQDWLCHLFHCSIPHFPPKGPLNCYLDILFSGSRTTQVLCFFVFFFSIRLLSVLRGHSVFSYRPQRPMTSDFEGFFYPKFYPLHLFSYLTSWERASIFPFECSVLNKGTTGTIFMTSLVWRGLWLGIEPGTSRTRSQHYTTRLSMRRSLTGDWTRDLPHSKPALYH